jgi:hypothetical protein
LTSNIVGGSGNVVTINDSAPTAVDYSAVIVEILAATSLTRVAGAGGAVSSPTSALPTQKTIDGLIIPGRGGGLMVGQAVQYG